MQYADTPSGLSRYLPVLQWLPGYSSGWLRFDLVAGLTAAAVVIPQAMAYAAIAGLITGEIIAACAEPGFVRSSERDSMELIAENPLLAYVSPGRFAAIERTNAFPFPADMKK